MRKIFVFNLVSLDGYFAGPNGEIDWHNVDAEFNECAIDMLKRELVYGERYQTREQARLSIFEYIEVFITGVGGTSS